MVGDEIEARKAGCDDYLPKPIDDELLMEEDQKLHRMMPLKIFELSLAEPKCDGGGSVNNFAV